MPTRVGDRRSVDVNIVINDSVVNDKTHVDTQLSSPSEAHVSQSNETTFEDLPDLALQSILNLDHLNLTDLAQSKSVNRKFYELIDLNRVETVQLAFGVDPASPRSAFNALMRCTKQSNGCFEYVWNTINKPPLNTAFAFSEHQLRALAFSAMTHNNTHLLNAFKIPLDIIEPLEFESIVTLPIQCLVRRKLLELNFNEPQIESLNMSELANQMILAQFKGQQVMASLFDNPLELSIEHHEFVGGLIAAGIDINAHTAANQSALNMIIDMLHNDHPDVSRHLLFLLGHGLDIDNFNDHISLNTSRKIIDIVTSVSIHALFSRAVEAQFTPAIIHQFVSRQLQMLTDLFMEYSIPATVFHLNASDEKFILYSFEYGTIVSSPKGFISNTVSDFESSVILSSPIEWVDSVSEQDLIDPHFEEALETLRILFENGARVSEHAVVYSGIVFTEAVLEPNEMPIIHQSVTTMFSNRRIG